MKKIFSVGLGVFLSTTALATPQTSSANVTADTVNINAGTINIMPSLTEQALLKEYKHPWWINVGGGLTTGFHADDSVFAGFNVSANIQPTQHQVATLRSSGAEFIGGDYYDVGALYGLITRNPKGYLSASAGIGAVFFEKDFLGRNDNTTTVGLPIEMQAFWTPVPNFGLGLIGYANVNDQHSFYGMVLALQLANLVPI